MTRPKVLFQGSHKQRGTRHDPSETLPMAGAIASALGKCLIRNGLDVVLTQSLSLSAELGREAVAACEELTVDPRERIRTYPYGAPRGSTKGFGMVLEPLEKRYQEVRTFLIQECDAIVAIVGGKGTADSLQKAMLARKPVFPIAVTGGAAAAEWERLRRMQYCNRTKGDLDFLADRSLSPQALADMVARHCVGLFQSQPNRYSRRIFLVHGHDTSLKSEIARFLERLDLEPVILHEQPDKGATIFTKLQTELADVGYAFVLMTPDDKGSLTNEKKARPRARQNVVFEHGLLVGMLGASRVCAIVKGAVELPSDLQGIVYKQITAGGSVDAIAIELMRELVSAGYRIDAQALWGRSAESPSREVNR
jgi:predicted nucleotide-binding protein